MPKRMPEYSVAYPATSSDSDSGRSNGPRFSPRAAEMRGGGRSANRRKRPAELASGRCSAPSEGATKPRVLRYSLRLTALRCKPSSRAAPLLFPSDRRTASAISASSIASSFVLDRKLRMFCAVLEDVGVRVGGGRFGEERRQRLGRHQIVVGERGHAVDQVAERHARAWARPTPSADSVPPPRNAVDVFDQAEVRHQRLHVVPFAQRRHAHRQHVQAINRSSRETRPRATPRSR